VKKRGLAEQHTLDGTRAYVFAPLRQSLQARLY
jgi:hypothetical protein